MYATPLSSGYRCSSDLFSQFIKRHVTIWKSFARFVKLSIHTRTQWNPISSLSVPYLSQPEFESSKTSPVYWIQLKSYFLQSLTDVKCYDFPNTEWKLQSWKLVTSQLPSVDIRVMSESKSSKYISDIEVIDVYCTAPILCCEQIQRASSWDVSCICKSRRNGLVHQDRAILRR
jgi:hypothetical protein